MVTLVFALAYSFFHHTTFVLFTKYYSLFGFRLYE